MLQEKHLGDHRICDGVVDWATHKHDAILEKSRIDIISAFSAGDFFDNGWNEIHESNRACPPKLERRRE